MIGQFAAVLVTGLAVVGCEPGVTQVEYDAIKKEADGLQLSLDEVNARTTAEISDLEDQLSEQSGARDSLEAEVEVLKKQLEEAQKEVDEIKGEFDEYQKKYRISVRENAPGRKFERVVVSGETEEVFTGVVIREINPARIRVMHDSGATTLPLANLSAELQAELAFDVEEATAFLEAEIKGAEPEVLTQEEKNQRKRDEFAKDRMINLVKWKKAYAEAERTEKKMAEVAAKSQAVVAAINRYYTYNRKPTGSMLQRVNALKQQRAALDKQFEELKIKRRKLLNQ